MDSDLGIIGVEYTEFKKGSYQGFRAVWGAENQEKVFNTGNVERDYVEVFNFLCEQGCSHIIHSSSVDGFLQDDDDYEWKEEEDGEGDRIVKKTNDPSSESVVKDAVKAVSEPPAKPQAEPSIKNLDSERTV